MPWRGMKVPWKWMMVPSWGNVGVGVGNVVSSAPTGMLVIVS